MSPYLIIDLALVAVITTTIFALLFSQRRKPKHPVWTKNAEYGRDDGQADVQPDFDYDEPFRRAAENVRKFPPVEAKSHPRPIGMVRAPYPRRRLPTITLSPRQIEYINSQRQLCGKKPLNRAGFKSAVASPPMAEGRLRTTSDWMMYLMVYESMLSDHHSEFTNSCPGGSVIIDPNLPYNGHGGAYGGAGASGDWAPSADAGSLSNASADQYLVSDNPPDVSSVTIDCSTPLSSCDSGSSSSCDSGSSSSCDSGSSSSCDN